MFLLYKAKGMSFPFLCLQELCSQQIYFPVSFLFLQVIEGKLAPFLGKVIKFATSHVYSCSLCSQKGFICEICNNGEILYPFEDISTSRYTRSSLRMLEYAILFGCVSFLLPSIRVLLHLQNIFCPLTCCLCVFPALLCFSPDRVNSLEETLPTLPY